jgi:hypothetical protein
MKKCDYCGRMNDDGNTTCHECGSCGFSKPSDAISGTESRKLDPDEIPLPPMAHKDGSAITLKCRTPEEAFLVCDELEKADIIPILPDEE